MGAPAEDDVFGLRVHPWERDPQCKAGPTSISALKQGLQWCQPESLSSPSLAGYSGVCGALCLQGLFSSIFNLCCSPLWAGGSSAGHVEGFVEGDAFLCSVGCMWLLKTKQSAAPVCTRISACTDWGFRQTHQHR